MTDVLTLLEPESWDGGLSLNFVHRRIIGGVKGFLGGGIVGGVTGLVTGGNGSEPPQGSSPVPGILGFQQGEAVGTSEARFRCRQQGLELGRAGQCVRKVSFDPLAILPGGAPALSTGVPMIGDVAVAPFRDTQTVRRCPRGRVLAVDGLCYNKRDLRKDQREWPPGRKPLLTGGDLNAISRAARAAGRMKTQQKRLQKLGLLPKPKTQRRIAPHHPHSSHE